MQFRVTGIYESGMAEYDDVYAFTDLADAQSLFQLGDAVSGYDLCFSRTSTARRRWPTQVQDLLGYPHYGRTVFETYRNLFSWIELQKKPVPIILGLIIIVATVNIIGTLLMMVLDKTREIGVLAAHRAPRRWGITRIFLRQGLTIARRRHRARQRARVRALLRAAGIQVLLTAERHLFHDVGPDPAPSGDTSFWSRGVTLAALHVASSLLPAQARVPAAPRQRNPVLLTWDTNGS